MIWIRAAFYKCGKCTSAVDMNFFCISSLLGPPFVVCHRCGSTVATDRVEWDEMSGFGKLWYFGISLFYLGVVGLLGGISFDAAVQIIQTGEWNQSLRFSQPTFWIGASLWAVFVVLLQLYRVSCSRRRSGLEGQKPLERSFRSFQIGVQFKCFLFLFLIPVLAWLGKMIWDKVKG